eukprot:TRINITY_DN1375_c0_g1_i2.p1 TRINITY_DN1375_c0_g1~~TRINITY_DN1375_c0_g1_i2.p1  ORF type:complete len:379 (+),score=61.58 TRINITY_DN1375_c0_g1_i2:27-1139(+)
MQQQAAVLLPLNPELFKPSARFQVGYAQSAGQRPYMEDVILAHGSFRGRQDEDLYAVFDGFGGHKGAQLAAERLPALFEKELSAAEAANSSAFLRTPMMSSRTSGPSCCRRCTSASDDMFELDDAHGHDHGHAHSHTHGRRDDSDSDADDDDGEMWLLHEDDFNAEGDLPEKHYAIAAALTRTFRALDSEMRSQQINCGTTALVVFLYHNYAFVANAGDTRAVLRRETNRSPIRLSVDHKPDTPKEKRRITNHGHEVSTIPGSVPRVNGTLAVSRALCGDSSILGIVWEPAVRVIQLQPSDEFILMATDGLWDKVGDGLASMTAKNTMASGGPTQVCEQLLQDSWRRQSTDNISVMCLNLKSTAPVDGAH